MRRRRNFPSDRSRAREEEEEEKVEKERGGHRQRSPPAARVKKEPWHPTTPGGFLFKILFKIFLNSSYI